MDSGWNRWAVRPPYLQAMLRGSTCFLVLVLTLTCQAQNWCPPGAKWTHEYADVLGGYFGVQRVEYVGDAILGGYSAQQLMQTHVVAPWGTTDYAPYTTLSLFTRYADDIVFIWDNVSAYDTLFWFGAEPGDRWRAPGWPDDGNIVLTVVDTATVDIDGVPLRRLVLEPFPDLPIDTLYERIGGQFLYLNGWTWFVTDMPWNGLMCYSDQEIDYAVPGVSDCGFTLAVPDDMDTMSSGPFPNPGTDHFIVTLSSGVHRIRVCDATGREVWKETLNAPEARIATGHLAPGSYTVRMDDRRPWRWLKR